MEQIIEQTDLPIIEELVGLHSMNPFIRELSSSRSYMSSSHLSQSLTPIFGDEKIVQTGLEKQFAENTFSRKTEEDVRVVKVIRRYEGVGTDAVDKVAEYIVITESLETGEIDYISIPYYFKLHQYFGFKYNIKDTLKNLRPNDILPKDTILADSYSVGKNNGYKFGVNANLCLLNIPETAEDGVVISKSLADRLSYRTFETRNIEFGSKSFPLNLYGDDKNYKPFPEIGETIGPDSVLCALREYDERLVNSLVSINDVRDFNPMFDKAYYVNGPGEKLNILGKEFDTGIVVDVKVYTNPKYKKDVYSGVSGFVERYANALKKFHKDILEVYESLKKEHFMRYGDNDLRLSSKFHRLLVDSMALVSPESSKINYNNRNDTIDLFRVEFVIQYTHTLNVCNKISDLHGSKGVIVQIKPDYEMPYIEANGGRIYADVVMDPAAVTSRMNPGRIYEQYFNAMSRKTQYEIKKYLKKHPTECDDNEINGAFDILLGLLKLLDTEQYKEYRELKDMHLKREIITECVDEEVFILYRISSTKRPYQIVLESKGTIYEPETNNVHMLVNGKEIVTKDKILIAPNYTILLAKTGETFLSVSSAKVNHFGIPVGMTASNKYNLPYRCNSTKVVSETEGRLYTAYTGPKFTSELLDRASNSNTHKIIYKNILEAPVPTNMDICIDRNKYETGNIAAMNVIENLFNSAGIEIVEES